MVRVKIGVRVGGRGWGVEKVRSVPAEPVDLKVHLLHEHLVVQRHVAVDDALGSAREGVGARAKGKGEDRVRVRTG